uniref:Uncharacterized protein n=1 Tax=Cucumis melo TaxID=3656 RepID=A0A9I9ELE7_CUCME
MSGGKNEKWALMSFFKRRMFNVVKTREDTFIPRSLVSIFQLSELILNFKPQPPLPELKLLRAVSQLLLPLWADSKAETEMSTGITLLLIRRLSLFCSAYFVPLLFSLLKNRVPSHLGWLEDIFPSEIRSLIWPEEKSTEYLSVVCRGTSRSVSLRTPSIVSTN